MTHPITALLQSSDPLVSQVATTIETLSHFAVLTSIHLLPVTLGILARDLGVETEKAEAFRGMTEYYLTVSIRGKDVKLYSIGETPAR